MHRTPKKVPLAQRCFRVPGVPPGRWYKSLCVLHGPYLILMLPGPSHPVPRWLWACTVYLRQLIGRVQEATLAPFSWWWNGVVECFCQTACGTPYIDYHTHIIGSAVP